MSIWVILNSNATCELSVTIVFVSSFQLFFLVTLMSLRREATLQIDCHMNTTYGRKLLLFFKWNPDLLAKYNRNIK